MVETAVPLNEVPPQELGPYSSMVAPTPALGRIWAVAQGSAGAHALLAPKPAGAYLYPAAYPFQQRAQTPARSVSSLRPQAAALMPYEFAPEGQNTPSLSDSLPSYLPAEPYAPASGGVPFANQESMAMAGVDAGKEYGAAVAEKPGVEEERGQGQLRAANSLLYLLNIPPGYVSPQ